MSSGNRVLSVFFGVVLMAVSVALSIISPPAITLYQNNGFFWWGFVPGALFGLGFLAIILPTGFPPEARQSDTISKSELLSKDDDWWDNL